MAELLSSPKPVGVDGMDGKSLLDKLVPIFGGTVKDDLDDQMYQFATQHGADADCRPLIAQWIQDNRPGFKFPEPKPTLDKNLQNFPPPTQDTPTTGQEYGDNRATSQTGAGDTSWNMAYENAEDPLEFIRNLAGLKPRLR